MVPLAEDTPPAREVLAKSRTMKDGGAAAVATLGGVGQSVLTETQTAILPLVPYGGKKYSRAAIANDRSTLLSAKTGRSGGTAGRPYPRKMDCPVGILEDDDWSKPKGDALAHLKAPMRRTRRPLR